MDTRHRGAWPVAALAACALCALAGCRQIAELPAEAPPAPPSPEAADDGVRLPVWLASEAAVFEHVQQVLEAAGCPEVRTAVMKVSDGVDLPVYRPEARTLVVPPFRDGPEKMRERIARMSARRFGGALTFVDRFDSAASADEGYSVFLTVAIAHELWHHVQAVRGASGSPARTHIHDREMEAVEVEQAFLGHLVAAKQVPARFRDHYRRAVAALRDAVPRRAFTALPGDEAARRQQFTQAYSVYGAAEAEAQRSGGVNAETAAGFTVFAVYLDRRTALLAKAPRPLAELTRR